MSRRMRVGTQVLTPPVGSWLEHREEYIEVDPKSVTPQAEWNQQVHANNLTFDCMVSALGSAGNVMLLHGFPEHKEMWIPIMRKLQDRGYRTVACDQRGYSPGAAPEDPKEYHYDILRSDVFAVADSLHMDRFHLVAHDHGAVLAWYSCGSEEGVRRIQSVAALSIPHPDAFSEGLMRDRMQQEASQYFHFLTMKNDVLRWSVWYNALGRAAGFSSASKFQKAMNWYNGALATGVLAMPPYLPAK
eukprot:CAMPEP_0180825202 /NCGR_PEP_ID=MMETSP1038_2-20121128/72839_1 /TAXON_ID=632150 /ORGANISM="Azadinium spinosum, Strain 3D9" /LENGTH=244 /DNA_ID=CAMNT_0022867637 /DNA_START=121 /DNA_END=852 /DNA_ORIENTATION=+